MAGSTFRFQDRADAGRRLAERLMSYCEEEPIVLALPRGGVAVGFEVARALNAPLDVVVARKLGAPAQPELGIGAIAPGGVRVLDEMAQKWLDISEARLEQIVARETAEMERRLLLYRGEKSLPDIQGRTVIVVDDGLATGVTARAAIRAIRQQNPRRIVLAVPVCAAESCDALSPEVDDLLCLLEPPYFQAVGLWYEDFAQVSDEEVVRLLEQARTERAAIG